MLAPLAPADRHRLTRSDGDDQALVGGAPKASSSYVLRRHQPGDIGWVIHRQGQLYAEEYGWDETYEALVAEILAGFIKTFDAEARACVDRRSRRRDRRFGVPDAPVGRCRQAAPALRRAVGARIAASASGWSTSASPSRAARATGR